MQTAKGPAQLLEVFLDRLSYSGLHHRRKPTEKALLGAELSSADSDVEDDTCFICEKAVHSHHTGGPSIEWISSYSCDYWFHETCIVIQ